MRQTPLFVFCGKSASGKTMVANMLRKDGYKLQRSYDAIEQIENLDILVLDISNIQTLLENYDKLNRKIYVLYFSVGVYHRIQRMISRGDSDTQIVSRLLTDEKEDWLDKLLDLNENRKMFDLKIVAANEPLDVVYNRVKEYIKENS